MQTCAIGGLSQNWHNLFVATPLRDQPKRDNFLFQYLLRSKYFSFHLCQMLLLSWAAPKGAQQEQSYPPSFAKSLAIRIKKSTRNYSSISPQISATTDEFTLYHQAIHFFLFSSCYLLPLASVFIVWTRSIYKKSPSFSPYESVHSMSYLRYNMGMFPEWSICAWVNRTNWPEQLRREEGLISVTGCENLIHAPCPYHNQSESCNRLRVRAGTYYLLLVSKHPKMLISLVYISVFIISNQFWDIIKWLIVIRQTFFHITNPF